MKARRFLKILVLYLLVSACLLTAACSFLEPTQTQLPEASAPQGQKLSLDTNGSITDGSSVDTVSMQTVAYDTQNNDLEGKDKHPSRLPSADAEEAVNKHDEDMLSTSIIPADNLSVTGEFSLRNNLGKLAAGTPEGLYFVLRGKLFFWEYASKTSLELANLDTRNGLYYFLGDYPEGIVEDPNETVVQKRFIPFSSLVLYKDRLYYAQETSMNTGESSYQMMSLNLQGQDAKTEFELPGKINKFSILDDGNIFLYEVQLDEDPDKEKADIIRLYYYENESGQHHRVTTDLFPWFVFCNDTTCYFTALNTEDDLNTIMQPYHFYSWDCHSQEIHKETIDNIGNGFYPQGDHLVSPVPDQQGQEHLQIDFIYANGTRQTVFERDISQNEAIYTGTSEDFSFILAGDFSQGQWKCTILDPEGKQVKEFTFSSPGPLSLVQGIVGPYLFMSHDVAEVNNTNYYLLDVSSATDGKAPEVIPLLPEDYFKPYGK